MDDGMIPSAKRKGGKKRAEPRAQSRAKPEKPED
jgi:hypothetical protein